MRKIENLQPDRIATYFRMERGPLLLVTVSGILYNVGMAAGPWFEGQLAQCLFDIMGGRRTFSDMLALALTYVGVILLVQAMRYLKRFYVRRFANDVSREMKRVLYACLIRKPDAELRQESVGSLMTKAVSDVDACAEGMRKFTTEIFDTGVVMVTYLVMLLGYDWRLGLLCCIFPPIAYFLAEHLKTTIYRYTSAFRSSAGALSGATLDRVSGALSYRVFGGEQGRDDAYETYLRDYEKKAVKSALWENTMPPIYQVISMASVVFIFWFGGKNVTGTGWTVWNIAAFTTFLSCFAKLAVKSSKAAKLFSAVQKAQVSWKRIKPLMAKAEPLPQPETVPPQTLAVSHLSFAYPDGDDVLKDISFTAEPGQIIGVTGPVAGGKSTLGKVFLCEYPYSGSIRLGGEELRDSPDAVRRGKLSYLGHEPELISGTIWENVALGEDIDVWKYLRMVHLDEEVKAMPADTLVGSGGVRLSGGQQARLALARTLGCSRPLMVLDDPFSALDRETEASVFESLKQMAEGRVILLISHRLYLFPQMDQVIWLDGGRAEVSTHEALVKSSPAYAELYRIQTEGGTLHEE